jgi:hypothetical protein
MYMEGVFQTGMQSPVHRHPGVEAWYTLEGEQCLETPQGKLVQKAGGPGVMDAALPRSTPAADWKPAGLCHP